MIFLILESFRDMMSTRAPGAGGGHRSSLKLQTAFTEKLKINYKTRLVDHSIRTCQQTPKIWIGQILQSRTIVPFLSR